MFIPSVSGGSLLKTVAFERHTAELWKDSKNPVGSVYVFLLSVRPKGNGSPVMCVAAEIPPGMDFFLEKLGTKPKPILCAMTPNQDMNMGPIDPCDADSFLAKAIEIVEQHLGDKRVTS